MATPRKRVSYVIPAPTDAAPRLQLPSHGASRLGNIGPLVLKSENAAHDESPAWGKQPRHRLGLASLAIDTSTQLEGQSTPQGILYTGGRDGLVMSWDLGIHMRRRKAPAREEDGLRRSWRRWEIMTGLGDDYLDEEDDPEDRPMASDGDVLGEVQSPSTESSHRPGSLPYEQEWETDMESFQPGKPSQFRQSAQSHNDWVQDILLCNYNQTLVSASSDGTIKAWNPHSANLADPNVIGSHSDYVRCLTQSREQNWIASGSFDRTVKLWDLGRSGGDPILTLNPPDANAPKSSVYALAADPYGQTIATGSPERVIRMWDPRSGKRTGKLVGHTDNIRAILISDDARYLLTGSADASVKLWSLASQRCLHTFTHHTDSVWSLFSSHPTLEVFYSGDKSGLVCKVDVEDCSDVSEGECIVLCQETSDRGNRSSSIPEGVNKIVVMDDNLLWTASGNSSVKRWRVPPPRASRAATLFVDEPSGMDSPGETPRTPRGIDSSHRNSLQPSVQGSVNTETWTPQRDREDEHTQYGIPYESLVRLISPNEQYPSYPAKARGRDPEVNTLYSAASVMSVPRTALRSPLYGEPTPLRSDTVAVNTARTEYEDREVAADAKPLHSVPDEIIAGDHGLVRSVVLNDRIHALTVNTAGEVALWNLVRSVCLGRYLPEDVAAASQHGSSDGSDHERSPREALEAVRERIEGEAVVVTWCMVDTKTGVLTVHLDEKSFEAEAYADEVGYSHDRHFNDESRLNLGKWVLRNLFYGFIKEEQRSRRKSDPLAPVQQSILQPSIQRAAAPHNIEVDKASTRLPGGPISPRTPIAHAVIISDNMVPAKVPSPSTIRTSPAITPMILLHPIKEGHTPLPTIPQSPLPVMAANDATPTPLARSKLTLEASPSMPPKEQDYFSVQRETLVDESGGTSGAGTPRPPAETPVPQTPSTPGGLMGRLRGFGKGANKKAGDITGSPALGVIPGTPTPAEPVTEPETLAEPAEVVKTPLETLLSSPLSPPPSNEAPTLHLPHNIGLTISEEMTPAWLAVYRGTAYSVKDDLRVLEEAMPLWLIEYLLANKAPLVPVVKISFVLLPMPNREPDGEQLPELLNTTQSKLTASRFLRVKKLTAHVQDKLDRMAGGSPSATGSRRSSVDRSHPPGSSRARPEDVFEILCNDCVLPLHMTLAAVRQFVWRQGGELTMYYRRTPAAIAASPTKRHSLTPSTKGSVTMGPSSEPFSSQVLVSASLQRG